MYQNRITIVNIKSIITAAALLIFSSQCFSQINIKCCGVDQIIPNFRDDSVFRPNGSVLEGVKVLPPITESNAAIEIRVYNTAYIRLTNEITVLKCVNDSFSVVKYFYRRGALTDEAEYHEAGTLRGIKILIKKQTLNQLAGKDVLNDFFQQLIKSHLFDLPSEDELASAIEKVHPGIREVNEASISIEIKVGSHYRSVYYRSEYSPPPYDLNIYKNQLTIIHLLTNLKK